MSTYENRSLACPSCATVAEHEVAVSLNAERRPSLRQDILDGRLQRFVCDRCGAAHLHETTFTYLDFERRQLIVIYPPTSRGEWRAACDEARTIMANNLTGPGAPPAAQKLGASMVLRVCFGLDALREKVLCAAHAIDDVALEALKLRLLLRDPIAHAPNAALRLDEVTAEELQLGWRDESGDLIVAKREALQSAGELGEALAAEPWVDTQRLVLG
jgi:hypothetical protein